MAYIQPLSLICSVKGVSEEMLHTQSVGFGVMEQQLQRATQKPSLPVILTYLTTVKLQKPTAGLSK